MGTPSGEKEAEAGLPSPSSQELKIENSKGSLLCREHFYGLTFHT